MKKRDKSILSALLLVVLFAAWLIVQRTGLFRGGAAAPLVELSDGQLELPAGRPGDRIMTYKGYAAGYGLPEWQWNAEITKSIGAFNLSLSVHDILNQTRNLTHTVTANYEEDSYRLVMGRYVLFGVKWNFGKMNAGHSARAQQAAMNMVF